MQPVPNSIGYLFPTGFQSRYPIAVYQVEDSELALVKGEMACVLVFILERALRHGAPTELVAYLGNEDGPISLLSLGEASPTIFRKDISITAFRKEISILGYKHYLKVNSNSYFPRTEIREWVDSYLKLSKELVENVEYVPFPERIKQCKLPK